MLAVQPSSNRTSEDIFTIWAKPPGQTEQEKCERALRAVKEAINASTVLSPLNVETFAQGSFANRTNVTRESDVDVCALYNGIFVWDGPAGLSDYEKGSAGPAPFTNTAYKDAVEAALVARFGRANVKRGRKAFHINENTYRVDADVVACFDYKLFYRDWLGVLRYHDGTALWPDGGFGWVTNFPKQHYENGVAKNEATGRRYKSLVRIIKNLRNSMEDAGIAEAKPMTSFLLESLTYNIPNTSIGHSTYTEDVHALLAFILAGCMPGGTSAGWTEANGIKLLFGSHNPWTTEQVRAFAAAAWKIVNPV